MFHLVATNINSPLAQAISYDDEETMYAFAEQSIMDALAEVDGNVSGDTDIIKKLLKMVPVDFSVPLAQVETGNLSLEGCKVGYINSLDFEKYINPDFWKNFNIRDIFKVDKLSASLKKGNGNEVVLSSNYGAKGYINNFVSCKLNASDDATFSQAKTGPTIKMNGKDLIIAPYAALIINVPISKGAQLIGDGLKQAKDGLSLILPKIAASGYTSLSISINDGFFALAGAAGTANSSVNASFDCTLKVTKSDSSAPTSVNAKLDVNGSVSGGYTMSVNFDAVTAEGATIELNCPTIAFSRELDSFASANIKVGGAKLTSDSLEATSFQSHAAISMRNSASLVGVASAVAVLSASVLAYMF